MVSRSNIGKMVEDADGRTGVLREILDDWEDPAKMPNDRKKIRTAFVRDPKSGREWLIHPTALALVEVPKTASRRKK